MIKSEYIRLKVHPDKTVDDMFRVLEYSYDKNREIVVTPYFGNYTSIAGYVIAVNGSPPQGTLIVPIGWAGMPMVLMTHKTKTINDTRTNHWKFEAVEAFLEQHYNDKERE